MQRYYLKKLEETFHPYVIVVMVYNRTWPIVLRYGTHQYGGLQMKSLEVEALIKNTMSQNTHA